MAFKDSLVEIKWRIEDGKCEKCGASLVLEHKGQTEQGGWDAYPKDGNPDNDAIINCQILCCSCYEKSH